jgi:hypothetical protein
MATFLTPPTPYEICTPDTDRSCWNPKIAQFYDYWLSIKPRDGLPGRQNFDPLDIPLLMPRVWMLDVLRDPLRYRYRLAGTKEVETLQREVTGMMFGDVHPHLSEDSPAFQRFSETTLSSIVSYRKGTVVAVHDKKHQIVENCIAPLARDGKTVDILVACSVLYTLDGREN